MHGNCGDISSNGRPHNNPASLIEAARIRLPPLPGGNSRSRMPEKGIARAKRQARGCARRAPDAHPRCDFVVPAARRVNSSLFGLREDDFDDGMRRDYANRPKRRG